MTLSSPYPSVMARIAVGALAAAAFTLLPSIAVAQRGGGGGHAGGGGGGFGGGGGHVSSGSVSSASSHSSAKPTARPAPAPAAHAAPSMAYAHGTVIHQATLGTRVVGGPGAPLSAHAADDAPRNSVIGYPEEDTNSGQAQPIVHRTGPMSFSGQGHDIWQNAPAGSATVSEHAAVSPAFLRNAPVTNRPLPPHRIFPPGGAPYLGYPGLGYYGLGFGYYGLGYGFGCSPFFGFGYDPSFGWGGSGFGYGCDGFGAGYGYGGYYNQGYGFGSGAPSDSDGGPSTDQYNWQNPPPADSGPASNGDSSTSSPDGGGTAIAAAPPATTMIYLKDGTIYEVMSYWLDSGKLHYITNYGGENTIDMGELDLQRTVDENARRGSGFTLLPGQPPSAGAPQAPNAPEAPQAPQQ